MKLEDIIISEEIFNEIKETSIRLWKTHGEETTYVTEKLEVIEPLQCSPQSVAKIIRMFDIWHQRAIAGRVSEKAKMKISQCIKLGWPKQTIGGDLENNPFFRVK